MNADRLSSIIVNMIMFIIFIPASVRTIEDTGVSAGRDVCVKPVFYCSNHRTPRRKSIRHPGKINAGAPSVRVRREYKNNNDNGNNNNDDDQSDNSKKPPPWLRNKIICQQQEDDLSEKLVFKNPEYIWGKNFNHSIAKTVCEGSLVAHGGETQNIHYTKRGLNTCYKACMKQGDNILREAPTTVTLKDQYCTKTMLAAATCVCVFKVSCHELNHYVFIHFIPNRSGDVAMLYNEVGHPLPADPR